jgi:ATP-binding cassette subfamily B protein
LTCGFFFLILQNFGYLKIPALTQKILDEIIGRNRMEVLKPLFWQTFFYIGVLAVSLYFMRDLIIGVSRKIEFHLREMLYAKMISLNYYFFVTNNSGDLISRFTNDLNDVRTLLGPGIMYIPNSLTRFILFAPILFSLSKPLMLTVSSITLFIIVLIFVIMPRIRPLFRSIQDAKGEINTRVWQSITGIQTIKSYVLEDHESRRFQQLNQAYVQKNMRLAAFRGFLWPFFAFVFSITEVLILYIGGRQVIAGQLSIGQLLQFNLLVGYLTFPVLTLGWIMSLIQQGISAMQRINTILQQPPAAKPSAAIQNRHLDISIRNLNFSYPGATEPSLHNISLHIQPGDLLAVTGSIGSGKTTLINVICSLLKPQSGMLFYNNTDCTAIADDEIYAYISYVPQQAFLFSKTIAENIAMDKAAAIDLEKVRQTAQLAGIAAEIDQFQQGFQQLVGERGITLSGGQKQRCTIARAFYQDTPILILDDVLSSVDVKTEAEIIARLKHSQGKKTMIIVSHRVSALKFADRIIVLNHGSIAETGTHSELISQKGFYAKMSRLQEWEAGATDEC